ncbi:MAG: hypothetical protein ACOXZR_04130 [Bacilli bacterium]|jgi:hypothetical protein
MKKLEELKRLMFKKKLEISLLSNLISLEEKRVLDKEYQKIKTEYKRSLLESYQNNKKEERERLK